MSGRDDDENTPEDEDDQFITLGFYVNLIRGLLFESGDQTSHFLKSHKKTNKVLALLAMESKWLDWICSPVRVAGKSPLLGKPVPPDSSGDF
ncbi:hypothetical protein WN944_024273 [Citrus x changshan-huyou]|uniref:Uncharacterized protein n=1 Tax=Citrus x changshan-huyou TaxID=2935761 RepID=A0AAP0LR27_9ROSI